MHVQLYSDSEDLGLEAAAAALAELRRIESHLSRFDDASDLAEINRMAGRRAVRVHACLARVLRHCAHLKRETGGAFDPAVEPLMRAWGFRAPRAEAPSQAEISEAREAVRAAEVRLDGDRVFLPASSTALDLGGIGVGHGLDRAGAVLREAGIERALIDISGDCLAIGTPPGTEGWPIGVAAPGDRTRVRRVVVLRDAALAMSSNLESVIHLHGVVAGHVMNPATGTPASARPQVTVRARRGILADALSTAALITGTAGSRGVLV